MSISRMQRACAWYIHGAHSWAGINCGAHLPGQIYSNPVIRAYSYRCKSEKRMPNSYASFWKRDTSRTKKDRLHSTLRGQCREWINVTLAKNRKTKGCVKRGEIGARKDRKRERGGGGTHKGWKWARMVTVVWTIVIVPLEANLWVFERTRASQYTVYTLSLATLNY